MQNQEDIKEETGPEIEEEKNERKRKARRVYKNMIPTQFEIMTEAGWRPLMIRADKISKL